MVPATSGLTTGCQRVTVSYDGVNIGTTIPDSSGSFAATMQVPKATAVS